MLVTRADVGNVIKILHNYTELGVDTETTGLRPYHGDKPFSIIISILRGESYYFNLQPYGDLPEDAVLLPEHVEELKSLFAKPTITWSAHKVNFDRAMLATLGIEIGGDVHCTKALALVEYNEHLSYSLEACAERIGLKKDNAVDKYITENKLTEKRQGATQSYTHKFYNKVPSKIIIPYGEIDGQLTCWLREHQNKEIERQSNETSQANESLPTLFNIAKNERRLSHTVYRMERTGLRIDRPYCVRASRFEIDRAEKAVASFKSITGRDFKNSPQLFATVFESEKERWGYTDEGNPSFRSEILKKFLNPAAKSILDYRDAKSKSDFYKGFLYHADENDIVHPNFNQDGACTGRFSSSDPNFQNLTSEEDEEELKQEFVVRRAIIPRPGYVLFMPDYDQMEYRMMFDYACFIVGYETNLVKEIKSGKDPHQASADLVTARGVPLVRKKAKNGNFALLYGSGDATLAATIKGSINDARALRKAILDVAPEIGVLVDHVMRTAETRGFIRNWAGRRFYCPNPRFSYQFPNRLIQGGTADVNKFALNDTDEYLRDKKSRLIATIHDENPAEIHESEIATVPKMIKEIMESIYPYKYLPLTVGTEWSDTSLADKKKGLPV